MEGLDIDTNTVDEDDQTRLSCAADYGHERVVNRLPEGVDLDPNITDKDGPTGLFWAVNNGHE